MDAPPTPPAGIEHLRPTNSTSVGAKGTVSISLVAVVPVLLVIFSLVVVLLLVLVWLNYRSKYKQVHGSGYQSVPTEDIGPILSLPYPTGRPKIKLMDPPIPGTTTQFVEAAQLGGVNPSRYPFTTDTDNSTSSSEKGRSRKTRRLSSRRAKPLDVKFKSSDRSSDGSEDGYSSPKIPSPASRSAAVTPPSSLSPVRRSSTMEEKEIKSPTLSLTLFYNEKDAVLTVVVKKASDLPGHPDGTPVDAYVRLFFIPNLPELPQRRTNKTNTRKQDNSPVFNEEIQYDTMTVGELINSNFHFEVLDFRSYGKHVVIGQGDLPLIQVQFVGGEAAITLPLKLPKMRENQGTILVSISYSPESKKLGAIILRAKDLNKGNSRETDVQAKMWITLGGERILGRLRTKKKAQSCSPIFNEALTCTVEPSQIKNAAVNISVLNESRFSTKRELGQVILCGQCSGEEFRHWNDIMATPGKHIAEWHELR